MNKNEIEVCGEVHGKKISFKTGWIAKQANGAVLAAVGDSIVIGAAAMSSRDTDLDYFPLQVHYTAKFYASGKIPGGYFRREAKPTDAEVLVSRLIDRPLRPLFPDGFNKEVQVVPTAVSFDEINPPDIAAINAASAALVVSDIPFHGPIGAVRVGMVDEKIIINPTVEEIEQSRLELIVAGTDKAITMIEGEADELSEQQILEALEQAHTAIQQIIALQNKLREKAGKEKVEVKLFSFNEELEQKTRAAFTDKMKAALSIKDKQERESALQAVSAEAEGEFLEGIDEELQSQIGKIIHEIEKEMVRSDILDKEIRQDERKLDEIRPLDIVIDVLPNVHGSALFTRGQTQALAVATLGSSKDVQRIDSMTGDVTKNFFLHYNFPPYSVGETGRIGFTGRREVGHGMLAERSLAKLLPDAEDFAYTIRVVSEILESNGSSSMATICGGSLALMNAGVPLKKHVAGIAMGLIMSDDKYKILTDIQGMEDHLGDMDFKVAGTRDGITGFQLDIKVEGITIEIMRNALEQARKARLFILDSMYNTIAEPRKEMSPNVPKCKSITIPTEKIKVLIGPGGKNIKALVEQTGSDIDIEDSGTVKIFAKNDDAMAHTIALIEAQTGTPKIGMTVDGLVKKVMPFGAFVEIMPGTEGLCHISELSKKRVEDINSHIKEGDMLKVKVLRIDDHGKISLTHKGI